ncbi:MAG: hypothetical protein IPP56_13815 [Bacteroidetes bacterium]|nr:hypothetical protein [Bacteroidota bacterium]MBK9800737.1 hypothetical protein [Bacteroidota bacterium]
MHKKYSLTIAILFILCSEFSYSQGLIPQNLSIEAKTNYYLIENLECREVVQAMDTTIKNLRMLVKSEDLAIKKCVSEKKVYQRLNSMYLDSINTLNANFDRLNLSYNKQVKRKKVWRTIGLFGMFKTAVILAFFGLM